MPTLGLAVAVILLLGSMTRASAVVAPDLERESRMHAQISDSILDGEILQLQGADGIQFMGIFTESESAVVNGTAIILHGRGFHPDWPNVIHPLRVGLTAHGWNTLAIQLPVLGKEALYFDYLPIFSDAKPRIEAALDFASSAGEGKIAVIAHSCGYHMAQHWITTDGDTALQQFDAFVGIGMGATDAGQPMQEAFVLDRIKVPVLDVFAQRDFSAVRRLAEERREQMIRGGHPNSAQVVVPDADHYFVDRGDALVEVIGNWLNGLDRP
jgi:pimeloyl-ACP methyl ester carboxylesterase